MLISEQYRAENNRQHFQSTGYGERGYKHLPDVLRIAQQFKCQTALDYGCGKATLASHARRVSSLTFSNYDPAIPDFSADPRPADLVVCTDVLEHIEPLCLHDVIEHLASLTQKAFYFQIACRPAKRVLGDGRNAHLLIRSPWDWVELLCDRFDILEFRAQPGHSLVVAGVPWGKAYGEPENPADRCE